MSMSCNRAANASRAHGRQVTHRVVSLPPTVNDDETAVALGECEALGLQCGLEAAAAVELTQAA